MNLPCLGLMMQSSFAKSDGSVTQGGDADLQEAVKSHGESTGGTAAPNNSFSRPVFVRKILKNQLSSAPKLGRFFISEQISNRFSQSSSLDYGVDNPKSRDADHEGHLPLSKYGRKHR